jgi:hypothetical protein
MKVKLIMTTLKYGRKYGLLIVKNKGKIIEGIYVAKEIVTAAVDLGKHVTKAVKTGYQAPPIRREPRSVGHMRTPPSYLELVSREPTPGDHIPMCAECLAHVPKDLVLPEYLCIARLGEECIKCERKVNNFGHPLPS